MNKRSTILLLAISMLMSVSVFAQRNNQRPPNWAQGTFYATNNSGEQITLTINNNGYVTANILDSNRKNSRTYQGTYQRGDILNINGTLSNVSQQGNGIVTTNRNNGESIVYSRNYNNSGNYNNGNQSGRPPNWARGTFYATNNSGEQITLTINNNGNVTANILDRNGRNSRNYQGTYQRGDILNINGALSNVSQQGNGIVTTNRNNGERIAYSRTYNNNGNYNNNNGYNNNRITPPRWAQGTFYATNRSGEQIILMIDRNGDVEANVRGRRDSNTYRGTYERGNILNVNGIPSNVVRQRDGIVTTNRSNGERIVYSRTNNNNSYNNNNGYNNNRVTPPNWAQGTFYATNRNGERITLMINSNGYVTASIVDRNRNNSTTYQGTYESGNVLNINGALSNVSRQGNGILTTNRNNGERISYSR